jgi:hypothetical protein
VVGRKRRKEKSETGGEMVKNGHGKMGKSDREK